MYSHFFKFFGSIVLCLFWVIGCATTGKLRRLNLQMTKSEVSDAIGKPRAVRGSMMNKHDQVIEVWEYRLHKSGDDVVYERPTFYWLFFCNGKLVQWGEAGDWQRTSDRIYEMRFR